MNFYEKYFLINLKDYSGFGIDLEINKILLFILIGALAAIILIGFRKAGMARVVKSLLRHEAKGEESAMSLDELKINTYAARLALSSQSGRLAKVISRVGAPNYTYEEYVALTKQKGFKEEKIDFATAKFYIEESKTDEAKRIYDRSDSPMFHTILTCVLLVALYTCLLFAMPGLLSFLSSLIS